MSCRQNILNYSSPKVYSCTAFWKQKSYFTQAVKLSMQYAESHGMNATLILTCRSIDFSSIGAWALNAYLSLSHATHGALSIGWTLHANLSTNPRNENRVGQCGKTSQLCMLTDMSVSYDREINCLLNVNTAYRYSHSVEEDPHKLHMHATTWVTLAML